MPQAISLSGFPGCAPFVPGYIFKSMSRSAARRGDSQGHKFYDKQFEDVTEVEKQRARLSYQKTFHSGGALGLFDAETALPSPPERVAEFIKHRSIFDAKHELEFPGEENLVRGDDLQPQAVEIENVDTLFEDMGRMLDFLREALNIDSLDNKGMPVEAAVNVGKDFVNAFWYEMQLYLGNGDGIVFQDFALDKTVTAHEMFHGLVELIGGGLIYRGMSGALNEHVADALAIMAVQYMLGQVASPEAHWLIGDIAMLGSNSAGKKHAIRTFKNERAYEDHEYMEEDDPQGKTMLEFYRGMEDVFGVHLNSGIPNHALYLAAIKIGGFSWKTLAPIWLAALIKVRSGASFKEFAEATVEMAERIFPGDVSIKEALQEAWEQVLVLGPNAIEIEPVYEIFEWDDPELFDVNPDELERAKLQARINVSQLETIPGFIRFGVGEREGKTVILAVVDEKKQQSFTEQIGGFDVEIIEEWDELKIPEAA